jgi:hypothetical protein
MKPSEHPEFFRLPPPEGRSRESTIVLDKEGRFLHDGALVTHPGMAKAFSSWIARHPDDGRFILNNGYDWTYFRVEDAPFQVVSLQFSGEPERAERVSVELSDGTCEPFDPAQLRSSEDGSLYTVVKNGMFEARFSRSAQLSLAPLLREDESGGLYLEILEKREPLAVRARKA